MNILVLGSGGREHAICWKLSKSPKLNKLFSIPGNAGIENIAECHEADLSDFAFIKNFCVDKQINFVVVGPEVPLAEGIVDYLEEYKINVVGCSSLASQLESSKKFTKQICDATGIRTANYKSFANYDESIKYLSGNNNYPIVIKADGLAAGKGVIIADNYDVAEDALNSIFSGNLGTSKEVVIEEYLEGVEASFFAVCDGKNAKFIGSAGDHKRIGEGDTGPNTGGMGTYSPTTVFSEEDNNKVMEEFILPAINHMNKNNMPFKGILFAGLMLTKKGLYLIEYNVRFGDPETQSILLRLESDLVDIFIDVIEQNIDKTEIKFSKKKAVTVVLASNGYPGKYQKNTIINGLEGVNRLPDIEVFHAGTKIENNNLLATGGRVLNICALGDSFSEACEKVYSAITNIDWSECYYRKDIAANVINGDVNSIFDKVS